MTDCFSYASVAFCILPIRKLGLATMSVRQSGSTARNGRKLAITKARRNSPALGSEGRESYGELSFKEKAKENMEFEPATSNDSSCLEILELKNEKERVEDEDFNGIEDNFSEVGLKKGKGRSRRLIRRSNMFAKQVICIQSALSLGFVSQIWVDTISWVVFALEVRPNLLSGESERLLLEDVRRVGDVILVEDENVLENELKMVGLETLVGYRVLTPGQRYIGKVRGYSFNIDSGAVELLELDSFGISIIPSSLVSTYALPIEDVLEVLSDTVIVHEEAGSRIQRITKGLWDSQSARAYMDEEECLDDEIPFTSGRSTRKSLRRQKKFHPNTREAEDDWELPMDYL